MWDYDRLNVNGTMTDKAVASSRTRALATQTFYMLAITVGPVRIPPLVAPARAVLERPCAQRVAISGPLGSRIVAAQRPLCCSV